jgi:hypothetical protein
MKIGIKWKKPLPRQGVDAMFPDKAKYIFIASFVIAIVYPLVNIHYIYPSFSQLLIDNTEDEAVRTAAHLSTILVSDGTELRKDSISPEFLTMAEGLKDDFKLEKLKVFAPSGEIIYSTDPKDIGKINKKSYFHEIVTKGNTYTKLVQKDTETLEGRVVTADVVETYVPIMADGTFIGAFEIYYDITERNQRLEDVVFLSSIIPLLLMLGFFLVIVLILLKSDKEKVETPTVILPGRYQSPYFPLLVIAVSVLVTETLVMWLVSTFPISGLLEAFFDASILVLLLSPALYFFLARPLMLHIAERKKAEESQAIINELLKLSVEDVSMEAMLEQAIDLIVSSPCCALESKGGIFLVGNEPGVLVLKAQRGLAEPLRTMCASVPFGRCLCGRAAESGEVEFASRIDERHENIYEGIVPHGHYCVPIRSADKVLGVINLYVKEGHLRSDTEEEFLQGIANVLAGIIQRKQVEEEIKETKQMLENIAQGIEDGILLLSKDFEILWANQTVLDETGYEMEEILGRHCYEITHRRDSPCEPPSDVCPITEVQKTGKPATVLHTHINKDGGKIFVEVSTYPIKEENGEIVQYVHVTRDITHRKEAEEKLRAAEEEWRTTFDSMADGVTLLSPTYTVLRTNKAALDILGLPAEGTVGKKYYELFHQQDAPIQGCPMKETLETKKPASIEAFEPSLGKYLHIGVSPILDEKGEIKGIVHTVRDKTKAKEREMEIKRFNEGVAAITRVAASINSKKDPETIIGEVLHEAIELTRSEMGLLITMDPETGDIELATLEGAECKEDISVHRKGLYGWVLDMSMPLMTNDVAEDPRSIGKLEDHPEIKKFMGIPLIHRGVLIGELAVANKVEDYTEEDLSILTILARQATVAIENVRAFREVEDAREELMAANETLIEMAADMEEKNVMLEDSNRLKDLFTDIMRHDLLNPIGVLGNFIDLLRAEEDMAAHQTEMDIMRRNILKLKEQVQTASKLAKIETSETLETEEMDISQLFDAVIESNTHYLDEKGMRVKKSYPDRIMARVNPVIEDVFSNLLTNAVKYGPEGSEIEVGAEERHGELRVWVKDCGEGVPDEFKETIFTRFTRADKRGVKGSGLGLAIARRIVDLHGGKIWVEDNPEGGSIFYFTIPIGGTKDEKDNDRGRRPGHSLSGRGHPQEKRI